MPSFNDIKPFVRDSSYAVDVFWMSLEEHLEHYRLAYNLDMDPDFQRGHVWTKKQKTAYIEYILQDGPSGRDIYLNCPSFGANGDAPMVLVDGKQRICAVQDFYANKIPIFGYKFKDWTDAHRIHLAATFRFHVNTLPTRAEVLRWYLLFNAGGTPHTRREIERVRGLLDEAERENQNG